ncbi:pentapeptide repeat-containing protein [Glaciibacter superstes]|uniref:pentapeptide repeat-containing protein n=1 Tax=Glaciibacter superstes TaxID=501023 RepID=UPI00047B6A1B|nr:pentapeptide repeat-containing protein [Glaciibacter superstes]
MAKKPSTIAPRIDPIRLIDLTDGDAGAIDAHGSRDGERFSGADVSGRDLAGVTFTECELLDLVAHETDFRSASFVDTRFERLNAPIFTASRSRFRDVELDGSRLGSAEFYDSTWESVHISNCKLGFVNLRGAVLRDVLFSNCTIDELDLGGATVQRVAFTDTAVRSLDVTRATLENVDLRGLDLCSITGLEGLRGATVNSFQVSELASLFATQLGIKVED